LAGEEDVEHSIPDSSKVATLVNRIWLDQLAAGSDLISVEDVSYSGRVFGLEVWQVTLVFPDREAGVWVILGPRLSYYLCHGRVDTRESEFACAEDAALYHHGRLKVAGLAA
jgi:hypothetical protein